MTNNGDSSNKKSQTKKQAPQPQPPCNDSENVNSVAATGGSSTSQPTPQPAEGGGPRLVGQPAESKEAPIPPPPGFPFPRFYATGGGSRDTGSTNVAAKGRGSSTTPNPRPKREGGPSLSKQPEDSKAPLSRPPGFPFPGSDATGDAGQGTGSTNVLETGGSSKSATSKPKREGGPKLKQPAVSKAPLPPPPGFPFPRSYATAGGVRGGGSSNMAATGGSSKAPTSKTRREGGTKFIRKHGFPLPRARGGSARGAGSSRAFHDSAGGGGILVGGSAEGSSGVGMTSEPPRPLKRKRQVFAPPGLKPICSVCRKSYVSWRSLFGHLRAHPERRWRGCFPPPGEEQPALEQNNQQQGPHAGADQAADGGNQRRADNLDIDLNQPQLGDFDAPSEDEAKKDDIGDGGFDLNKPPKPDDENAS